MFYSVFHLSLCLLIVGLAWAIPVSQPTQRHAVEDKRNDTRGGHPSLDKLPSLRSDSPYEFCDLCKVFVEGIDDYISSNKSFDHLVPYFTALCDEYLTRFKGLRGDFMCPGLIDSFGPLALFIAGRVVLDPKAICEKLNLCLPDIEHLGNKFINQNYNTVARNKKRKGLERNKGENAAKYDSSVLRILQLTDIHIDPSYSPGAAVQCGLYICCRSNFNGTGSAGNYGEYERCDLPVRTLDLVLSAIQTLDPAPDFIVYTGDSPPHDVWQQSWTSQLNKDDLIVEMMASKLKNFTIYPAIGNHESFPESFYYQPGSDYQHLNTELADWWGSWFDITEQQRETIEHSAYYTALVKPGLRILSFNSDYGYTVNFFSLMNDQIEAYTDQITFIQTVLEQSRQTNEKVIVIAHVPPGDKFSSALEYGDFYTSLATNYSDVIALHMFGHTHHDEYEVVLDPHGGKAAEGVVFIAPSVTPYGQVNPGFRVYQLDGETFELIDYDQYYLNLTEANLSGKTDMKLLYSAKAEYGLPDMSAESWKSLSDRMATDDVLFEKYRRNRLTGSGLQGSCDPECKNATICETKSASLRSYLNCIS